MQRINNAVTDQPPLESAPIFRPKMPADGVSRTKPELLHNDNTLSLSAFAELPLEIHLTILEKLPEEELNRITYQLSCTSIAMFSIFKLELKNQGAKKLLQIILRENKDQALKMFSKLWMFLFIKSSFIDYAGREIQASPYQAIIGTTNIALYNEIEPYYTTQMNDGLKLAITQFHEQFSNKEEETYNFEILAKVIGKESFSNKKINPITEKALITFREELKSARIHGGKHFDMNLLANALDIYDTYFSIWTTRQASLYWINVIGYLQRLVPTCHFINMFGSKHIPLKPGLGYEFALYGEKALQMAWGSSSCDPIDNMKRYIRKNNQEFEKIKEFIQQNKNPRLSSSRS